MIITKKILFTRILILGVFMAGSISDTQPPPSCYGRNMPVCNQVKDLHKNKTEKAISNSTIIPSFAIEHTSYD